MGQVHQTRRDALRKLAVDLGVDAVLVTRLVNVRYLSGFTGSNAALLVSADGAILATDGRYITQSAEQAPDLERLIDRNVGVALASRAAADGVHRLAFEAHDVTVQGHGELLRATAGFGTELVAAAAPVECLRTVKDAGEIELIRTACTAADQAFDDALAFLRPGLTEREVAWFLESRMREHGADGPSFETIVASGPNSAVPHHRPTGRVLESGDFVKMDFGALVAGYHSDMTRTLVLGEPADWQREIYDLVHRAQAAGVAAVQPGVDAMAVDEASRSVIKQAGYGEQFVHGLGHGIGLEVHEAPMLGYSSPDRLDADMVVTVEPGVYLPGRGGVRIEDTLVVPSAGGSPEILTTTTKALIVL